MSFIDISHQSIGVGNLGKLIPLVVILGPTAVGKTEISLQLAEQFNGEIVSADSRLFYRGMDIGTAKPTIGDRLRVPHHLIDVADPDKIWSLAVFQKEANKAIQGIHGQTPSSVPGGWDGTIRTFDHRRLEHPTSGTQSKLA